MEPAPSGPDHLQRKQLLYQKFGPQVEAVLASKPELLRQDEIADKIRPAQDHATQMQLEMMLRKRGIITESTTASTGMACSGSPVSGGELENLQALLSNPVAKAGISSDSAAALEDLLRGKVHISNSPTHASLPPPRRMSGTSGSSEVGQQFAQVDEALAKLKTLSQRLEIENQVLSAKLHAAQADLHRKDDRIRALERALSATGLPLPGDVV